MSESNKNINNAQFPADAKILARQLKPLLDGMERGRLQSLQRISTGWRKIGVAALITVGVSILILMITSGLSSDVSPWASMRSVHLPQPNQGGELGMLALPVVIIGIVYSIVIYSRFINGHAAIYKTVYKEKVIAGMTRMIQPEMSYSPDRGISEHTFKKMGLYNSDVDRYHCEDLFAGKIGKTALMFSEAHAEEKKRRTDSKGRSSTYWVTVFKGLLTIVDFNKDFKNWVIIKPDFAESSFGWFGRTIQNFNSNLVRLENQDFEKAFVVHGGDQVEARYLLTPDMQERILDLRRWFGSDIRLAFHSSRLHLTIPNSSDWFEPNIKISAHDTSQMHTFLHQMTSIFRIVQMLDLNTRIWTKD